MKKSTKYESAVKDAKTLESVIPKQLAEYTTRALSKLNEALGGDVGGYVANRLHMSHEELREACEVFALPSGGFLIVEG